MTVTAAGAAIGGISADQSNAVEIIVIDTSGSMRGEGGAKIRAARAATIAAINHTPAEVTLAFDPYAKNVGDWVGLARTAGHETLISLPMEPDDFPTSDPEVSGVTLDTGRMVCLMRKDYVLAKEHSLGADDLKGHNMIFGYADKEFLQLIDNAAPDLRKNARCDLLVNHYTVAAGLAQRGLGVALVDEFTVTGSRFSDLAIVPFEPEIPVNVGVIYPRYKPLSTSAQKFIETLGDALDQFRIRGRQPRNSQFTDS